jgi:hypothetical protein
MFNTEGVGIRMFYLQTEFQTPDSYYLFLTVLKAKAKENCHTAAGLLPYILQKYYLTNIFMFSSKVYYYTALQWHSHLKSLRVHNVVIAVYSVTFIPVFVKIGQMVRSWNGHACGRPHTHTHTHTHTIHTYTHTHTEQDDLKDLFF